MATPFACYGVAIPERYIIVILIDHFIAFPPIIGTKYEAYERNDIGYLINMFVMMHYISGELRQASVSYDSHDKESRTAFRIISQAIQGQGKLRGVHDGHKERHRQHSI